MTAKQKTLPRKNTIFKTNIFHLLAEEYRNRTRAGEEFIYDILLGAVGVLFSLTHAFFGVYPFAFALLCAVKRRFMPIFLGSLIGCFLMGTVGAVYALFYLLIFALRLFFSYPRERKFLPESEALFQEKPQLRITVSIIIGFSLAAYEILIAGVLTYALLFSFGCLVLIPLITLAFLGFTESELSLHSIFAGERLLLAGKKAIFAFIAVLVFLFTTSLGLSTFVFFGINMGVLFSSVSTLFVSRRLGALRGGALGLIVSAGILPLYAPAFALFGLAAGVLFKVHTFLALFLGVVAGSAWGMYIGDLPGLLSVMPSMSIAALLVFPWIKKIKTTPQTSDIVLTESSTPERLHGLSHAFLAMSDTFSQLAEEDKQPEFEVYATICEEVCARHCRACANRKTCWHGEKPALKNMQDIARRLWQGERGMPSVPDAFAKSCPNINTLLDDISKGAGKVLQEHRKKDKKELIAADYSAIAALLSEEAAEDAKESALDSVGIANIRQALQKLGVPAPTVNVWGDRSKRILIGGVGWDARKCPAETLQEAVENAVGCALTRGTMEVSGERVLMRYTTKPKLTAHMAMSGLAMHDGQKSGDNAVAFQNKSGMFYALLSDGMGSGKEAALVSTVSTEVMQSMLSAGNCAASAMQVLNSLVRCADGEYSATVDLLSIDLLHGKASFTKSGAATSYVRRGENLYRIRSKTAPIGILKNTDAEKIEFSVKAGDVIILLSDGVSQTLDDAPWLVDFLSADWKNQSAESVAKNIVTTAREQGTKDDLTALLVTVGQAS